MSLFPRVYHLVRCFILALVNPAALERETQELRQQLAELQRRQAEDQAKSETVPPKQA
jgi:hypothetical protein